LSGAINQTDKRIMRTQSAAMVTSSITLATALDSISEGKEITSYLYLVNRLSGINCFWGNITLCQNCSATNCVLLSEKYDFEFKHDTLIRVEQSIVKIKDALQRNAAVSAEFAQAAKLDQIASQNFRMTVVSQVQKSSDTVRSVGESLRSEWECLGVNNALPLHRSLQLLMCDMNSRSAASVVQISCQCWI
jgi:hypothetical protein